MILAFSYPNLVTSHVTKTAKTQENRESEYSVSENDRITIDVVLTQNFDEKKKISTKT